MLDKILIFLLFTNTFPLAFFLMYNFASYVVQKFVLTLLDNHEELRPYRVVKTANYYFSFQLISGFLALIAIHLKIWDLLF